jgi:hypothetical protein
MPQNVKYGYTHANGITVMAEGFGMLRGRITATGGKTAPSDNLHFARQEVWWDGYLGDEPRTPVTALADCLLRLVRKEELF